MTRAEHTARVRRALDAARVAVRAVCTDVGGTHVLVRANHIGAATAALAAELGDDATVTWPSADTLLVVWRYTK